MNVANLEALLGTVRVVKAGEEPNNPIGEDGVALVHVITVLDHILVGEKSIIDILGPGIGMRLYRVQEIRHKDFCLSRELHHHRKLIVDVFIFYAQAASFTVVFRGLQEDDHWESEVMRSSVCPEEELMSIR